jgi:hypothetical protein
VVYCTRICYAVTYIHKEIRVDPSVYSHSHEWSRRLPEPYTALPFPVSGNTSVTVGTYERTKLLPHRHDGSDFLPGFSVIQGNENR